MANFDQNVNITVDVDVKTGDLGKAVTQLGELEDNLDGLEGKLGNLEESFDAIDTRSINESVEEIDDIEIEPSIAGSPDKTNKGILIANTNSIIEEVEDATRAITPRLAGKPNVATGKGLLTINSNKAIEEVEQSLQTLDIKISGDVKWGNNGGNWAAAKASYNAKIESFESTADLTQIEPEIAGSINTDSLKGLEVPDGVSEDLDEINNLLTSIRDVNEANQEALETAQDLREGKADLREEQSKLQKQSDDTGDSTLDEAQSFAEAMDGADGLAEAKQAATRSNRLLNDANEDTTLSALKEVDALDDLGMTAQELGEELGVLSEMQDEVDKANRKLSDSADGTRGSIAGEGDAFQDVIGKADNLAEAKDAAKNANVALSKRNEQTAKSALMESRALDGLGLSAIEMADVAEDLTDQFREESDSVRASSGALRSLRRNTDNATDSMRAAAEVGDIFEDGLGSLSVNLGAFTVALRNFLTQVPLLLTALGAAGSAALGAAAGFLALAGAMGAVVGAGALAHAQQLKSEYAGIEELGQSMQVIMLNLRDVFFQALEPLTNSEATIGLFSSAVTGLARAVNVIAKAIAGLTEGTEQFNQRMEAGAEPVYTVQDAFEDFSEKVGPAFRDLVGSITIAFEELGEEMVAGTAKATTGLANMIDFSVWLFDQIEDLSGLISQFGDTLAELSILGARIGGGLLPVFKAFSTVMEEVAGALNDIDSETMQNAITFLILMAAINKVSGVASSLLTILPNLVIGMGNIASSANGAAGALGTMRAATAAAGGQLGGFLAQTSMLGGMTSLVNVFGTTGERLRNIAFNSTAARAMFDDLADEVDNTSDELRELAIEGMLAEEVLEDLDDTDVDFDVDDSGKVSPQQFLPDDPITGAMFGGALFGGADDAAEEAGESVQTTLADSFDDVDTTQTSLTDFGDTSALDKLKGKLGGVKKSFMGVLGSIKTAAFAFGGLLKRIVAVQFAALKTAVVMTGKFAAAMVRTAISAFRAAGAIAAQTIMVYQYTGSLTAAASTLWGLVTAQLASAAATARDAAMKAVGAAANFLLSGSALIATSSMYALATSIAVATGGISILVGLIGALAVGIITNFGAIKSAAADSFGFLKQIIDIIVDVLLTYFVTVWNLLVDIFQSVVQGLSPLTNMFMNLAETLGLVGGKGEEGAGMMAKLGAAGDIVKGVIKGLGTVFSAIIDILGGVLWVASMLIRVALMPLVFTINLLVAALDLLGDFWDFVLEDLLGVTGGVSGLIDMFMNLIDTFLEGLSVIPKWVEQIINFVIGILNGFLKAIPFLDTIEEVNFTKESDLKTNRDELAADSRNMREGTAEKGDKTITYNEDNSTNIDQTVNADPEDQAQLSRVVTDAIAEANSFERRRQGGQ